MSFLDEIGQRSPGSSQQSVRSAARDLPYQEADRVIRVEPAYQESLESDGTRSSGVTWAVVLIVVVVIAAGGWMGLRRLAANAAAETVAVAANEAEATAPPEAPAPQPRTARPRPRARAAAAYRRTTVTNVVDTTTPTVTSDTTSDVSSPAVAEVVEQRESPDVPVDATASAVEADAPAAVAVVNDDDGIYSSGTPGIIAPQLESLGFAPNLLSGYHARTSRIELLISKSGTVERAKVTTPSYNMQDAMLVSRAKTLQFVPAYKDGAPVRFQLVLEVDTAP